MKIMTILGTRPEIIRLSRVIPILDEYSQHVLVHTGQNYEDSLNKIFFTDLKLREPDYYLGVQADSFGEQIGRIMIEAEKVIVKEKPDRILILGDTNSGLASLIAKRLGIPMFHMEAGNRCFDERVPEEVNRKVIDHSSSVWLPYTYRSKENLLAEGIPNDKIYVIGNPIYEVIEHYTESIEKSGVLEKLKLEPQGYFLVTMHRAENVDDEARLADILEGLKQLQAKYEMPVICSLHPRTKNKMEKFGFKADNENIRLMQPFGFFDFAALEYQAACVITDSGTVQEECCLFGVPNITIRDVTERPETIECGSNILCGVAPENMLRAANMVLGLDASWEPPTEYMVENVSEKVVKIMIGYYRF